MLDPDLPTAGDPSPGEESPITNYWKPPDLDPRKALPPYSGYKTYRHYMVVTVDEPAESFQPARRSRLASCLWTGITLVVIFSLLGTSFLAYFVVRRDAARPQGQLQAALAAHGEAAELLLHDSNAPLSESTAPPLPAAAALVDMSVPAETRDPMLNRLVVVNGRGQLETMAPDGTGRQSLTRIADGTVFQFPAWSPDGRSVAAIGTSADGGGIFVFDDLSSPTATDEAQRYFSATQSPVYLYWSPDSAEVAFLANHSRDTFGLNIVPSQGGAESRVVATGSPLYWNWAADSQLLLLHSGDTGTEARLVAIDSNGEEQTPNLAQPGMFQAPGISPSGQYWSYAEDEGRGVSTLVVAHTGTGERRLIEQAGSLAMTWSPSDEQLAYTSGGVDAHPFWGPLRIVNAETGDTRLLTTETVLAFFWSPDGRQIAYLSVNANRRDDGYAAGEARTQRVSRLVEPTQQGSSGFLSLSVLDVASGRGLHLLDFEPTAVFALQFMPFFAQYALSHSVWSPDSMAVVLPVRDNFGDTVMVIPVDGGSPRAVAEGDMAFWSQR